MGKGRRIETRKIPGEYDGEIGSRRLRLGWKESESLTVSSISRLNLIGFV